MKKTSNYLQLKNVIDAVLYDYTDEVREKIEQASSNIAQEGVQMLNEVNMPPESKSGTSLLSTRRQWKNYSKGWKVKNNSNQFRANKIIYNKTNYRLTHLLEYGHETRNGQHTRGFEHIKPVEEKVAQNFFNAVKEIVENG